MSPKAPKDAFSAAADILDPPLHGVARFHDDPAGFVTACFDWAAAKSEPTEYQLEGLKQLVPAKRLAERGPHGLGKTAQAAWLVHWFALTRDAAGEDWKVLTTASVWRQLEKYLWPEIHKWARLINWDAVGRRPYRQAGRGAHDAELLTMGIKLRTGEASAVASNDPGRIEGAHADQLLYIFDEAKIVPADTFEAAEGAFSGAGDDTANEAFAIAFSTPGEPVGTFYDIHKRKPGYEDWEAIHVTVDEAIKAKRISKGWVRQRARQWGRSSAVFQNRVLGEFASSEENTIIPLTWIEQAVERWHSRDQGSPLHALGCDIARSGEDKTVIAHRHHFTLEKLDRYTRQGTMDTTGKIIEAKAGTQAVAIVDVIGIGAGVVDRLAEQGHLVEAFNSSRKTAKTDVSGELGFTNQRSAAWWNMRELLDPDSTFPPVALPPDDELIGDLTAPTWKVTSGGKIQLESKDDIKARIGRSTDVGDACVYAFWPGEPVELQQIITYSNPTRIGADI